MTQLKILRRQLAVLRRRRSGVRNLTAYSALLSALTWAFVGVFVVDIFFFEAFKVALDVPQRIILIVLGATATFAAFYFLTRPLIGVRETTEDMALLVERKQKIDSDLIAAMQFESPDAAAWGSRQLEVAVIDYVAKAGRGLNVFEGFSIDQMVRRALVLLISAGVVIGLHIAMPDHMAVFRHRLAMSAEHYPTDTVIERVVLNHQTVFVRDDYEALPESSIAPQGQPLTFTIQCRGDLPEIGKATFVSSSGGPAHKFEVDLVRLSNEERLARLRNAESLIKKAISDSGVDLKGPWQQQLAGLVGFDAPQVMESLKEASKDRSKLKDAGDKLGSIIAAWTNDTDDSALYTGTLDRFVDPLTYTIHLGDAWTDSADVEMIPLPIVEPRLQVTAPEYARGVIDQHPDPTARQISVLEGSEINIAIECANEKRLAEAWITVTSGETSTRLPLVKQDTSGQQWSLDAANTPFENIEGDVRFEIQVEDEDGLHLESPIRGYIRIRPDRPPAGTIHWVHKLATPVARLSLDYNITDDFGIDRLVLHTQVERIEDETPEESTSEKEPEAVDDGRRSSPVALAQPAERLGTGRLIEHEGRTIKVTEVTLDAASDDEDGGGCVVSGTVNGGAVRIQLRKRQLVRVQRPVIKSALPLEGQCEVDLSQLGLQKGDRLKVELEIVDYRGDKPGKSTRSDSLVLEITDESGVLAAVSEADERSEKQLTDIIKRQLGIGETP
jgi:hypothetical protein